MPDQPTDREQNYEELSATPLGNEEQSAAEEPSEEQITMEDAMAQMGAGEGGAPSPLRRGELVEGVVVHIDNEGVLVDVGTKSEGTIKPTELSSDPSKSPHEVVSVGEKIKVCVVEPESSEGGPVLSKKRADFFNAWDRVEEAFESGSTVKAMVTDRVKGGLVVDLGIRGFVPASHVGSGRLKNLEKFIGQSMQFKVIEVDRERRKVVLSNRIAVEEEQEKLRKETLSTLAEGQIREGVVRRITDYGAFIDLGGVDGLLHVSEMSWTRINHPSDIVKVGQKLQVMVLKLNLAENRVSLGLRQIMPDPWEDVRRLHKVGDVIQGTVTRLVPFGAFVQVEGGVEGIIPNSELAIKRVNRPEDVVSVGQTVEVKIIDLRPDERRLTLSLRQLQTEKEKEREDQQYRSYTSKATQESKTTIGDLIGAQLGDLASSMAQEEEMKKGSAEEAPAEEPAAQAASAEEAQPEAAEETPEPTVAEAEVEAEAEAQEESVEESEASTEENKESEA